jgi:molecular chaperone GrpE
MSEAEQNAASAEPAKAGTEAEFNAEELLELLRRERASFLNYKRRIEQERAADRERARGEVVLQLLPVLDELERALSQLPPDLEPHPWAQGVHLIHRRLSETLRDLGVKRIGTVGEAFDPTRHEAVLYEGPPDAADQRVGAVIRPGYQMGERLLRPAQVSVVGPPSATAAEPPRERHNEPQQAIPSSDSPIGG